MMHMQYTSFMQSSFFSSKNHKPRTCISARGGSRGGWGGGGGGGVMGVITISNLKSRTSLMPSSSAGSDGPFCLIITNYPARACASKGLCDRSWCLYIIIILLYICKDFFLSFKILTFRRPFQHRKASLLI